MKAEKLRNKKPIVTIILSLCCKDAIVIAADSRTTDNEESRDDTEKTHLLKLEDAEVIVAASGSDDSGSVIVESLRRLAEHAKLDRDDVPANLLADAIREYKRNLVERTYGTMAKLKSLMLRDGLNCELLTAYYFNGKQRVYTADFEFGTPIPRPKTYWAMGVGKYVANYLLRSFDVSQMTSQEAVFTAIHVIREVKESVQGCGGPTRIAIVGPGNKPEKLSSQSIQAREYLADELRRKRTSVLEEMKSNIGQAAMEYQSIQSIGGFPVED
jgi:20S proteasome alpha/beta subunit